MHIPEHNGLLVSGGWGHGTIPEHNGLLVRVCVVGGVMRPPCTSLVGGGSGALCSFCGKGMCVRRVQMGE